MRRFVYSEFTVTVSGVNILMAFELSENSLICFYNSNSHVSHISWIEKITVLKLVKGQSLERENNVEMSHYHLMSLCPPLSAADVILFSTGQIKLVDTGGWLESAGEPVSDVHTDSYCFTVFIAISDKPTNLLTVRRADTAVFLHVYAHLTGVLISYVCWLFTQLFNVHR